MSRNRPYLWNSDSKTNFSLVTSLPSTQLRLDLRGWKQNPRMTTHLLEKSFLCWSHIRWSMASKAWCLCGTSYPHLQAHIPLTRTRSMQICDFCWLEVSKYLDSPCLLGFVRFNHQTDMTLQARTAFLPKVTMLSMRVLPPKMFNRLRSLAFGGDCFVMLG